MFELPIFLFPKKQYNENHTVTESFWIEELQMWQVKIGHKSCFEKFQLFLCSRHKIPTCCIVLKFESTWCDKLIRFKIKEKLVAWRDLAWWWWWEITISSDHWRCLWTPIIHVQFVHAETIIPIWLLFL